jgi:hypothetical protein
MSLGFPGRILPLIIFAVIILGVLGISFSSAPDITQMVEMRDGTRLATDVHLSGQLEAHGAVLLRTPYDKDGMRSTGMEWSSSGWPTVIQDMRGRYGSEGRDTVFFNANTDGPDTLSWMASQSWSNGRIATFGGSALGINQYFMAGADPEALACQYIQVATPDLHSQAVFQGGQLREALVEKWLAGQGSTYIIPSLVEHENYSSEYWSNVTLRDKWSNVHVPAIHIGGWYDCFAQGTIDGFMGYQYQGGEGARGKSKLIMGPWTHGQGREQGELVYPQNEKDDFSFGMFHQMALQYTMDQKTVFDDLPAVTYYVMGDVIDPHAPGNEWRQSDDWPVDSSTRRWYLNSDNTLSTSVKGEGSLTYGYDPSEPIPTLGGQNLNIRRGPYDQISLEDREDVLVFTSDVLDEPYEATGRLKACLHVSSDRMDTDFTVKLTDVYPDGRSMLISDGILRMRNRNGMDHWEFMETDTVYEVMVDLWSTSYIWNEGHRIRVDVSSSNSPRFLPNPNTGDPIYGNDSYLVANNTLHLGAEHPSCMILPEVDRPETVGKEFGFLPDQEGMDCDEMVSFDPLEFRTSYWLEREREITIPGVELR